MVLKSWLASQQDFSYIMVYGERHHGQMVRASYDAESCWKVVSSNPRLAIQSSRPGRVAQSVGHPTHKSGVLGSIPGLATYFRFSFRFFKKGSCQLLAKVCARSIG